MSDLHSDMIDCAAGLPAGGLVQQLREQRSKVVAATRGSWEALFSPALEGLALPERFLVALYACRLTRACGLALRYHERNRVDGIDAALLALVERAERNDARLAAAATRREAALLRFTRLLIDAPQTADRGQVAALADTGLSTAGIVALAQLIGFVSYQARLAAGLGALHASGLGGRPHMGEADTQPGCPQPLQHGRGFTDATLDWRAWTRVLDLRKATRDQLEVLEESHPQARISDYYLLLALQCEVLKQRSAAFNAIMYAPGGLPRAERELASIVVSCVNGCVYCASVHAQCFRQLAQRDDVVRQVFADPRRAGTTPREQAIAAFSVALTERPESVGAHDLRPLEAAGLTRAEILDLIHVVSIFAWSNRLMLALGEPIAAG